MKSSALLVSHVNARGVCDRVTICSHWHCHCCNTSMRLFSLLLLALICVIVVQVFVVDQQQLTRRTSVYLSTLSKQLFTHSKTTDTLASKRQRIVPIDQSQRLNKVKQCIDKSVWDAVSPPLPHTPPARPFPPFSSPNCSSHVSGLSVHQLSALEYQLFLHRMGMTDDEMDHYDILDERWEGYDEWSGTAIPYPIVPSSMLQFAEFDSGRAFTHDGGKCELIQLGAGIHAHQQSLYVVTNAQIIRDETAQKKDLFWMVVDSNRVPSTVSPELSICTPSSAQPGQEQTRMMIARGGQGQPLNCPQSPQPYPHPENVTVTYLLSRHNSGNPWHTLIEHMYPQWVNMFLRGDFPYTFQEISALKGNHYKLLVFHETGGPNSVFYDTWWEKMFSTTLKYVSYPTLVPPPPSTPTCCELCILGPPKTLAVYDFWDGGRFVYNTHTQVMIRTFRRFAFARWNITIHKKQLIPVYSFQHQQHINQNTEFSYFKADRQTDNKEHCAQRIYSYTPPIAPDDCAADRDRVSGTSTGVVVPYYQLPDFPHLLDISIRRRAKQLNVSASRVGMRMLNDRYYWDYSRVADTTRTVLLSPIPTISYTSPLPFLNSNPIITSIPLVVFTRRNRGDERAITPWEDWLAYYQQAHIQQTMRYHLLLLFLEDLPWEDQVVLFSRASMLLTAEGASEINILYMPLRSVVIEIECKERFYDGFRPRPWHQSLSQYLGHLHIQWAIPRCRLFNATMDRIHDTITRTLASKERNK